MTEFTFDSVLQQALLLSWDDRERLVDQVWQSLHPPNPLSDEEINAILEERIRESDEGRAVYVPWEEARRQIFEED